MVRSGTTVQLLVTEGGTGLASQGKLKHLMTARDFYNYISLSYYHLVISGKKKVEISTHLMQLKKKKNALKVCTLIPY